MYNLPLIKLGINNNPIVIKTSGISKINAELMPAIVLDDGIMNGARVLEKLEDYKNPSILAASAVKIDTSFETVGAANLEKAIPNCWIAC